LESKHSIAVSAGGIASSTDFGDLRIKAADGGGDAKGATSSRC
jgi:hypothetical protein